MKPNDDALELAEQIDKFKDKRMNDSAAHIRRLVAENEAQAALIREMSEAMYRWDKELEAIRQHLEGKA